MKPKAPWFGFLTVTILLMPYHLPAQSASAAQSPELTGLADIALRISDLDQEVNFFGRMGFEEAFSNIQDGHTLQVYIKVNDMQFIELYPQGDLPQPLGFMYASYESSDLRALRAKYLAEGLHAMPMRRLPRVICSSRSSIRIAAPRNSFSTCPIRAPRQTVAGILAKIAFPIRCLALSCPSPILRRRQSFMENSASTSKETARTTASPSQPIPTCASCCTGAGQRPAPISLRRG